MRFKHLLAIPALAIALTFLVSCEPIGAQTDAVSAVPGETSALSFRITWTDYSGRGQAIAKIVDGYNESQTGGASVMKKHTTYGVEALRCMGHESDSLSFIRTAAEIAGTHHEKYDGTGYPNGLAGKEIPFSGRMMAIIDVYDALVNQRVYKPAFPHKEAMRIIADDRGKHFDPEITDAFFQIEANVQKIEENFTQR